MYWVQEEPENMGAWRFLRVRFWQQAVRPLSFPRHSRPPSASPATGSSGRISWSEGIIDKASADI